MSKIFMYPHRMRVRKDVFGGMLSSTQDKYDAVKSELEQLLTPEGLQPDAELSDEIRWELLKEDGFIYLPRIVFCGQCRGDVVADGKTFSSTCTFCNSVLNFSLMDDGMLEVKMGS